MRASRQHSISVDDGQVLEFGTWTGGVLGATLAGQYAEIASYPVSLGHSTSAQSLLALYQSGTRSDLARRGDCLNKMSIKYVHVRDLCLDGDMDKNET